jgi:hypothetical protein
VTRQPPLRSQLRARWCDEQFGPGRWFHVEVRLPMLPDTLLL